MPEEPLGHLGYPGLGKKCGGRFELRVEALFVVYCAKTKMCSV